jgi:predicted nucleic acid-binding protein
MIILDTKVISEPLRQKPHIGVVEWIDQQNVETLYLTTITVGELRYGLAILPDGKRKTILQERLESEVLALFKGRILAYDLAASEAYGVLMARAKVNGLSIGTADGNIAAIAKSNVMKVATRDASPFIAGGVEVINPWQCIE